MTLRHLIEGAAVLCVLVLSNPSNAGSGSGCKVLHTDVFGDVYAGSSPFSIGKVNCSTEGNLHADVFGEVYCGSSPFSVGRLPSGSSTDGLLCQDEFGDFYIKGKPFEIDVSGVIKKK